MTLLVDFGGGVDPNFKDGDELTAADAAAKSGLEELADLLREAQST